MKNCTNDERDGKGNGRTAGFGETIGSLLRRYEGKARRLAAKLAGNPEDAKELVQEASVRILTHWETYDPVKDFQRWYLRIVRNAFLDSRKKYEFRFGVPLLAPVEGDEEGSALIDAIADGELGVQEEAERDEAISAVRSAVSKIPPNHQEVVNLCDIEGKAYDEAALELGISLGTVRSRLFRARETLRKQLSQWAEIEEHKEARKS